MLNERAGSPVELGYRFPAEWEPHAATWLAWPHNPVDWPGKMEVVPWVFAEMARKLSEGERVCILVFSPAREKRLRLLLKEVGVAEGAVEFLCWKTNRSWTRDFGPIFLQNKTGKAIAHFWFNAWAKYSDWDRDDKVAVKAARHLSLPLFRIKYKGRRFVLEGGAIDGNGKGALLTTEECLLDQTRQARNPGLSRKEIEQVLKESLGAGQVIWLGRGIAGDEDTHGHVDDLCRFVNANTVVLCREPNGKDVNHRPLEENRERLSQVGLGDGARLNVVDLPMPAPLYFRGRRLPASYANFYIGNKVVLMPTFNDPKDRQALGLLSELFPDRTVCGVHAVDLVLGLGSVHCLTQQEPA